MGLRLELLLKTFFIICGVLGLSPYTLKDGKIKLSRIFESLVVAIFLTKIALLFYSDSHVTDLSITTIGQNMANALISLCSISMSLTAHITVFKSRHSLLNSFNKLMLKTSIPFSDYQSWQNLYRFLKYSLPLSILMMLFSGREMIFSRQDGNSHLSLSYFSMIMFMAYSVMLLDVYNYLNNIALKKKATFSSANRLQNVMLLEEAAKELIDELNNSFTFLNLLFVLRTFFSLLSTELNSIQLAKDISIGLTLGLLFFGSLPIILHCVVVVVICEELRSKVGKTLLILDSIIMDHHNPIVRDWANVFSLQLLHRPVAYSVCGFFHLDYTLLYSMVGAVTTYVITLSQFESAMHVQTSFCNDMNLSATCSECLQHCQLSDSTQ